MNTFVALLRGINVGKTKRIAMADLKKLLSSLGYGDVVTLLNSGNAVFRAKQGQSARYAKAIASAIERELGLDVPVVVKSAAEFDAIVAENPFAATAENPSRLLVVFAQEQSSIQALDGIHPKIVPTERFAIGRHAAYLDCPSGILESKAATALLGAGPAITTRNLATVLKLHALTQR